MAKKVTKKPSEIMGMVDYVVERFPGSKFRGLVAPENGVRSG